MKYIILQTVTIPSIFCDLFVFFYLFRHWRKEIISRPHNHVIFCLLIVSFLQKLTDVPFVLYYLQWYDVLVHSNQFCLVWIWLDYSTISTCLHLLTWCCIERHLFIFHNHQMKMKRSLILFHYIPLFISFIYMPIFLNLVIFFATKCINTWFYDQLFCGGPCYINLSVLSAFDWIFNCTLPNLVIIVVNALLFIRLLWQKVKRHHPIRWKRQRRLAIQLLLISSLFLIFFGPMTTVGLLQTTWKRKSLVDIQQNYFYLLPYFTTQLLPFIIAGQLKGMRREWMNWLRQITVYICQRSRIQSSFTITDQSATQDALHAVLNRQIH